MTSPCSVSLSRPSTEPGAWPRIARLVGPPPRPMAPPRPWNSVSSTPRRRGDRDERRLGPVEHPGGREEARFLVRVGVAEHHLLAVAAASQVRRGRPGRRAARRGSRRRRCERLARLEQRHDVEDRRRAPSSPPVADGVRASSSTSVTSDGRRREADDVAMAGLDAEPRLDRGDRPERGEDLAERDARRRPRVAPGAPVADRRRAPPGGPPRAGGPRATRGGTRTSRAASAARRPRPRRRGRGRRRRARPGSRPARRRARPASAYRPVSGAGLAGQRRARPAQPLGDEPEPLAVRLVREAAAELAVGLGQVLGVAGQPRRERPRDAGPPAAAAAIVCISRVATAS